MPGRKILRRLQFGREVTNGTAVAATARMRMIGSLSDDRELTFPDELVGIFGGADRSFFSYVTASISIGDTPATPEQLPYLLAGLFGGPVTGTIDGTGSSGFRYITTIPVSTVPTNTSFTVEGGDDLEVERMNYGKVVKLVLKGAPKQAVMMSADLIGQSVSRLGTGFSTTTLVEVNDLIFAGSRLFIDNPNAIGITPVVNDFLGFEITIEAMWTPKPTGEGVTGIPSWSFPVFTNQKITGKITLEHDPISDGNAGVKRDWRINSARAIRIDVLGQSYATAGTGTLFTGGRRGLRIDLPIRWTKVEPLGDMDGNDIITAHFESKFNSVFGGAGSITVCNEVSALP